MAGELWYGKCALEAYNDFCYSLKKPVEELGPALVLFNQVPPVLHRFLVRCVGICLICIIRVRLFRGHVVLVAFTSLQLLPAGASDVVARMR